MSEPIPPTPLPSHAPLPGWVAPLAALVTQVGVPTVVAGVLLWFVLARVDSALHQIQTQEDARTQFVAAMEANFIEAIKEQTTTYIQAMDNAMDRNIETNKQIAELARQHGARPLP